MAETKNILALYDCRSKQEYIYRTNRVQEITGASELLSSLFKDFFNENNKQFRIKGNWHEKAECDFIENFNSSGLDAEVIYEGGGNLCVIFKDKNTYINVNKALSRQVLEKTYAVSIIASAVEVSGDFVSDRAKLYAENAMQKNLGSYHIPCNVLPFTQVDRLTYQPIVEKTSGKEYTSESIRKQRKYEEVSKKSKTESKKILENEFDAMTEKGTESLLAIIYIDGNNMGKKVKETTENVKDYTAGVNALRGFSENTNQDFVEKPIKAIEEKLTELYNAEDKHKNRYSYRKIISGGDEITIVCNAHAVPDILDTYFETLTSEGKNSACAGVAIFHSHAPFADVYEIAEQSCEMGKKLSHKAGNEDKNYIDFHYCHAGITNSLDEIREHQEAKFTARPYEYSTDWQEFKRIGSMLKDINRSDVKALGEAIIKGDSYYKAELKRILSRNNSISYIVENESELKSIIFDISIVYDLWFDDTEVKNNEQD
ncbi:MAG: Cas10/Cmr2 second palm domain-containing protein [Oscillospiraceae bacterium]